jgi:hypothetical protein
MVFALGRTGGRARARCCPDPPLAAQGRGSPRPVAETGRRADPTPSFNEGEGNAQFFIKPL